MSSSKKIKTALISVFHKDGLDEIIKKLDDLGVQIYSTGGTETFIESLGVRPLSVESLTDYPSILGGRVKTLHPKVFGGILSRRNNDSDNRQMQQYGIPELDLVIVDLYPFEKTVASKASEQEIIEKIDIGGISLIRAAAKNFHDVLVVSSQDQYAGLLTILTTQNGETTLDERKKYAHQAFDISSHYDSAIFQYFAGEEFSSLKISEPSKKALRYGENPHQKGFFYGHLEELFDQLHGKEISYNNLLDIDAAVNLISEFDETTFAILKHNNACGLASREKLVDAWKAALAGDPVSAFGGVLVTNQIIDKATADEMHKLFFEVVIAPDYAPEALAVLQQKKNRIILKQKSNRLSNTIVRTTLNGYLVQEKDQKMETKTDMEAVTNQACTDAQLDDLVFANKIVKHSKSNTIVLAKNKQLCASGVGQTSRIDALKHAIEKAGTFGLSLQGAVMASDAFFPFADSVEIAHEAGITAVVQPGGSIRDKDSIAFCNENNMAMVFTGIRHFKH